MRIVLKKATKELMRYAKWFSENEGNEAGFFLYYLDFETSTQEYLGYDVFPTELNVGRRRDIDILSNIQNTPQEYGININIVRCGSFHTHAYKKYLDSIALSVDGNRFAYIKECCRNYLSFIDLDTVLKGIIRGDSIFNITCNLSDIEDHVSYYIPKNNISIDEFRNAYNRFITEPRSCVETIDTPEGRMSFPTPAYRIMYDYIFNLFDEKKFDLYIDETVIDI